MAVKNIKNYLFFLFILLNQISYCQVQDIETRLYSFFAPDGSNFLLGKEDIQYHPARRNASNIISISSDFDYHDILRQWVNRDSNFINNYQYGYGIKAEMPFYFFKKGIYASFNFNEQILSSRISGKNADIDFTSHNMASYSFNSSILMNDSLNKYGIRFNYSGGKNPAVLIITTYPEDKNNSLTDRYFFNLLEPAFGNNIGISFSGKEINYALEYSRFIFPAFNAGINFYQEYYNYDVGINYFSNVENLNGDKYLKGPLYSNRIAIGLTGEYYFNEFIFRASLSYSIPFFKIEINQQNPVIRDGIDLEINNLVNGSCNGKSISGGIGISYKITENMSANSGIIIFSNNYSGNVYLSSPVLGYEIIPIVHQFRLEFNNDMKNYLLSLSFNHKVNSFWNYSIGGDLLHSYNTVDYNYKIITEFGIGHGYNMDRYNYIVNIYKLNLSTSLSVTENIILSLIFNQFVPVVENPGGKNANSIIQNPAPVSGNVNQSVKNWGGSVYSLSVKYNL